MVVLRRGNEGKREQIGLGKRKIVEKSPLPPPLSQLQVHTTVYGLPETRFHIRKITKFANFGQKETSSA